MRWAALVATLGLAACADVEETIDYAAAPAGLELGHRWDCKLNVQLNFSPDKIQFIPYDSEPCTAPGPGMDVWLQNWVDDTCMPALHAAEAAGDAPEGGGCGGECDAENWHLCVVGN